MVAKFVVLHNLHIIHTDLKPENILLTSSASDDVDHDHVSLRYII